MPPSKSPATNRHLPLLTALLLFLFFLSPAAWASPSSNPPAPTAPAYDPTSQYDVQAIEGWTVLINKRLHETPVLRAQAIAEMDHQLYTVNRRLPAPALAKLKHVRIWLEQNDRNIPGGVYHPSVDWLREHGYNPDKAKCIEIGNARNLVDWSLEQPCMLLHEFSHAYHDQVLGYDDPSIEKAYRDAVASKKYESVLHVSGRMVRHYALTNDQEFFAEMSEAFFGTNDFYPFVHGELKTFDPETYKTIANAWHIHP